MRNTSNSTPQRRAQQHRWSDNTIGRMILLGCCNFHCTYYQNKRRINTSILPSFRSPKIVIHLLLCFCCLGAVIERFPYLYGTIGNPNVSYPVIDHLHQIIMTIMLVRLLLLRIMVHPETSNQHR
jgi:hypothetical protein